MSNEVENPKAVIGDNEPPVDIFAELVNDIDDLIENAGHWLDGSKIKTADGLKAVSLLLELLKTGGKSIEKSRVLEKKPWDEGANKVQTKHKSQAKRIDTAIDVCENIMEEYMLAQEAIRLENERQATLEAAQAAKEAELAAINITSLGEAETAGEAIDNAEAAAETLTNISKQKTQATGGKRAVGLKQFWDVELVDFKKACNGLWKDHRVDFEELAIKLAKQKVRAGDRALEGFKITGRKGL